MELTSTWIPLGLLAVLCAYMVHLFRQERRESMALAAAGPEMHAVAAEAAPEPAAAPAEAAPTPVVEATPPASEAPAKRKRGLLWRTAWIWLPFLAGFAGQAWLDIVKPLVEKASA